MLQLSMPSTSFFYMRPKTLSTLTLVFIVVFDVMWIATAHPRMSALEAIGIPLLVSGIFYAATKALKNLTSDDVDEVWLDHDALVIKNRGVTSRVAFGDVTDAIDATIHSGSGRALPRLRLTLRCGSSSLGDSISFLAGGAPGPFGPLDLKSILVMLERRIDEGRGSTGGSGTEVVREN